MSIRHPLLAACAAATLIIGGCAEVRTQTEQVEYLKKPLKPLPDVATYSVTIDPGTAGSPSMLSIEGKKVVAADGDVQVKMKVGQPEITRADPGQDVYIEYAHDKDGKTIYVNGEPLISKRVPVYWIDVQVSTVSAFDMAKKDGSILESQTIPMSSSFVYGKKPDKLLGGAVTLWSGTGWQTDPVWLAAQWQIQGNVLVRERGAQLQSASLRQAAGVIEQNYSQGMRTAQVPVAFFKDEQDDIRLVQGYQEAVKKDAESVAKGIELWQSVINDNRTNPDGKPMTTAMQRACARLNIASVRYIQGKWDEAITLLNQAATDCSAYDEGFFEGMFKGNRSKMSATIQRLMDMVQDRKRREEVNAPVAPAKPAA